MTFIPNKSEILYADYQSTLSNGSSITSGWLDMQGVDKVQFSGYSDTAGLTVTIDSKVNDTSAPTQLSTPVTYTDGNFYMFNVICRQRFMKFTWTNNTGGVVNDASMEIKASFGGSDKLSVFPVSVTPSDFSQAALVQSILRGRDDNGTYRNVQVSESGALITALYDIEVLRGKISGVRPFAKFGINRDIDTGSTPEAIWSAGGVYTGFDATGGQAIEVLSSDVNDSGSELSNGTATGGSTTTLVDSGANFVGDGVAVGDLIINDTGLFHGVVITVAATTLTVSRFTNGTDFEDELSFSSGDSYRVATADDTGAAVVKLSHLLDTNYTGYTSEYIIMNGTTAVDTVGTSYLRNSRAAVVLAGSSEGAEGTITGRQTTTTANVFWEIESGYDQTLVCCDTVPAGKTLYITSAPNQMGRSNGAAGSAETTLYVRQFGQVFNAKIDAYITDGVPYPGANKVIQVPEFSDFYWGCPFVSDNNTVVTAEINGYLIDN